MSFEDKNNKNNKKKPFVLAVVGPTASGKTWLGVELAKIYGGEVISADSIQIYKGLDIASAKPTREEMQGIPHHLIDFLGRDKPFSVSEYVNLANEKIQDILSRGKLPIVVGGTGLYVDSLLDNIKFTEIECSPDYRAELEKTARTQGNGVLYEELMKKDPEACESIHINNTVRILRALEVINATGRKFSEIKAEGRSHESPYDSLILGLDFADRSILYDRINRRVDDMVERGLVQEAYEVWREGGLKTASKAIGYKELIPYFSGETSLEECIANIKQQTRHYAKRQLTWFRKNKRIRWIIAENFSQKNEISEKSQKTIANYRNL